MNKILLVIPLILAIAEASNRFPNVHKKIKQEPIVGDPGEPLFLTPLIEQNQIEDARTAASVDPEIFLGVESYAGYFTVNEAFNSNLFFWFFPSESSYEDDPVVLWLQGGPGATSLFGLFMENGPFSVNSNFELERREYSWNRNHSVLYIDNPVGTGYSFTNNGYAQNETQIGKELYNALQQFFKLFPELQQHEFFITGESYGGKYVPAISYTILKENPGAEIKINLQGLAIGNGFSDPINQNNYSDYLYNLGFIDSNARSLLKENEVVVAELINVGKYKEANTASDFDQVFYISTGYTNYYNYLYPDDPIDDSFMGSFVQSSEIRAAIHVGDSVFDGEPVYENLEADIMQSITPWISELLANYRTLIYNGQLDIICAYPMTVGYLQKLDFDAADVYKTAERYQWHVGGELAGYVKEAGNLTEVLVRAAGHMVPTDQPRWAYDLLYRFVRNQHLYEA